MPLKYGFGIKEVNMALGMIHGGLTMVFVDVVNLDSKNIIHTLVHWCFYSSSLLPFGAFVAESRLKQQQQLQYN